MPPALSVWLVNACSDRVVVGGAGQVGRGQAAEHLARERGHRNGACPPDRRRRCADRGRRPRGCRRSACAVGSVEKAVDLPVLAEPLEVAEEERLVPHDRTAEHAAELVAAQRRLLPVGRLEEGRRVQRGVAEELPGIAVELVGAAAIRDVDGRAGRTAVFRALVVRHDAELADRVGRRLHHLIREPLVARAVGVVVHAVDQEVVERAAQAVDVERAFARRAVRCSCSAPTAARRSPAAPATEYSRPFSASSRIWSPVMTWPRWLVSVSSERRRGRHLDLLGHLPDCHLQVHAHPRADLHLHVVHERDREARLSRPSRCRCRA